MLPDRFFCIPGIHYVAQCDFLIWLNDEIPPSSTISVHRVVCLLFAAGVERIWIARPDPTWKIVDGVWDWHPNVNLLVIEERLPELLDWKHPCRMQTVLGVNFIPASTRISSVAATHIVEFLATGPLGESRPVALVTRDVDASLIYGN